MERIEDQEEMEEPLEDLLDRMEADEAELERDDEALAQAEAKLLRLAPSIFAGSSRGALAPISREELDHKGGNQSDEDTTMDDENEDDLDPGAQEILHTQIEEDELEEELMRLIRRQDILMTETLERTEPSVDRDLTDDALDALDEERARLKTGLAAIREKRERLLEQSETYTPLDSHEMLLLPFAHDGVTPNNNIGPLATIAANDALYPNNFSPLLQANSSDGKAQPLVL